MRNFFIKLLSFLSFISKKKVLYINTEHLNPENFAVKTDYGFWFCGNLFRYDDIAYGFASTGKIEPHEMGLVRTLLQTNKKEGYIFYDIGSNTGPYSLLAATVRPDSVVHSFDPVPQHLSILKQSIALNNFSERVYVHETALSDKKGTAKLTLSGTGSSLEKDFMSRKVLPTIPVTLCDLDSYVKEHTLKDPDFIKIDVEGHEEAVIRGAQEILQRSRPILFVEIALHLTDSGRNFHNTNYHKFLDSFSSLGYKGYICLNDKLIEYSPSFDKSGAFMYLFLHKETHLQDNSILEIVKH